MKLAIIAYTICILLAFTIYQKQLTIEYKNGNGVDNKTRNLIIVLLSIFWIISMPIIIYNSRRK